MKKIRNIGILSHVDAGKTTITEQFLFLGGAIKNPGDVNKGTTVSDKLKVEQERGVSVRASDIAFEWNNHLINLIDTPGHTDFSAEVERSLRIIDGAILVISAVEGIQSHTYALWDALKARQIPVIIFINKIDRQGADFDKIVCDLEKELNISTFVINCPENADSSNSGILNVIENKTKLRLSLHYEHSLENLADVDVEILEAYLEENGLTVDSILSNLKLHTLKQIIFPVYTGIAKMGIGIPELLNAILYFFQDVKKGSGKLSALVYKIEQDQNLGRLAYVRVFDGEIKVRDNVLNQNSQKETKVAQIKKSFIGKLIDLPKLEHGNIGILVGLAEANAGDILGSGHSIPPLSAVQVPMMTVQVSPDCDDNFNRLADALEILYLEDPSLNLKWHREENELHINLMGKIQMEIIEYLLKQRFDLDVKFGQPSVIYKETPEQSGLGFASYTMPKPCWAVVTFAIEPGERGSGIVYESRVSVDKIKQKYQNEIENIISKALAQGIKGWEVTDAKITLVDGEDHEIHSRPGDFIIATPMALMNGLSKNGTTLLEPVLNFVIKAPEGLLGKVVSDLHNMRGTFLTPTFGNGNFELRGTVPAATSMEYAIRLGTISGGKGQIRFSFLGYESCKDNDGEIRPYKGVNPLDRSRWILHARGAFKADERRM